MGLLHQFNDPRRGLMAFVIRTRDGHAQGVLYAGTTQAAAKRAQAIAGNGATTCLLKGESHGNHSRSRSAISRIR